MTDSTARGAKPPAAARGPKPAAASREAKSPTAARAPKPAPQQAARPAANRGAEDTVVRPSLKDRIGTKLVTAAQEHRDTAVMKPSAPGTKQPRRARLKLTRIDPWSVMKASFLLSMAFGIVLFVAVFIVWSVLGAAGVWDSINATVATVMEGDQPSDFDITAYVGMSRVLGFTVLIAVLDVILITAMATLSAFLYNMAAALLGGVELTLSEDRS